ncbi:hypothetical protein BC835DRAFT_1388018 [Cytidiella melzeri]|nr:hypothetical protein BC835DRAFT_1395299 [Cytidiella melzeri]KAI0684787.1 hypothetical protein BC835DRAFT_1388018 [Cytidiella melzeri]
MSRPLCREFGELHTLSDSISMSICCALHHLGAPWEGETHAVNFRGMALKIWERRMGGGLPCPAELSATRMIVIETETCVSSPEHYAMAVALR